MASILSSTPHPSISLLHKTPSLLLPRSLHLSFHQNPNISNSPNLSSTKSRKFRIDRSAFTDDLGERSVPDAEPPSAPDPAAPDNEDEWGKEGTRDVALITDEWGEKTELEETEFEAAESEEDEWGNGSASTAAEDEVGELKRCLVDTFYGTELGFRASAEVRGEIFELVSRLEGKNPTSAPNEAPGLLDGNWILLYTAFSELLPLLAVGATPALKIKKISQSIDSKNKTIVNATTLSSPFATFSFSASASFEVESPSRIQVQFKEGELQPPEVSSTLNLPDKLEFFGQKIDLQPVQQSLNPIQLAVANLSRGISGQPPLKLPIPGNSAKSWLLTTYLDQDFRISRGDGGLFILAKEGSPLLDQLSS